LLVLTAALAAPLLVQFPGRLTEPPQAAVDAACLAMERARSAETAQWAPDQLAIAEGIYRSGLAGIAGQSNRFILVRDFTAARDDLAVAALKARRAVLVAGNRREAAKTDAEQGISRAEALLDEIQGLPRSSLLRREERSLAQRARLSLDEARGLAAEGAFREARAAAEESSGLSIDALERLYVQASRYTDAKNLRLWLRWRDETIQASRRSGGAAILVVKDRNLLTLLVGGRPVRVYEADMGTNLMSDKSSAGDGATPEGRYHIATKKGRGRTLFHLALLLDYPTAEDRRRFEEARRENRIPRDAAIGGMIEIHGEGGQGRNWTKGCIALSNGDMEDLFPRVATGTPVTIIGSDGTGGRLLEFARAHAARKGKKTDGQ
jgi:L,D-peptidoglycan transpeptidase YkuD (ErfK/YbiS/YcfS/YnhG family)